VGIVGSGEGVLGSELGVIGCPSAVKYSANGPGDAVMYSDSPTDFAVTKLGVLDLA
jgi:hypothetical protein